MILEVYADNLDKKDINKNIYNSARGIIIKNNQVLLLYSKSLDYYMLPGGRREKAETFEACIIREIKEEIGFLVKIKEKTVIIKEYYPDSTWESHFFILDIINHQKTNIKLTEEETNLSLEMKWFAFDKALQILDNHESCFSKAYNIMQRDFLALINSI
ncbi:MAG: NUDIX hydrolase [Bacillota bacterium]